jgi:hypothetical protein
VEGERKQVTVFFADLIVTVSLDTRRITVCRQEVALLLSLDRARAVKRLAIAR